MNETTTTKTTTNAPARTATDAPAPTWSAAGAKIDKRYARLVRLAYLVLPATGRRRYRLAIAQRIVEASLPRRSWSDRAADHAYAPIRSRVLRHALRPPRRLRVGLGPQLRRLPKTVPSTPARLAALDPPVRAAYVLRRVESMPRHMVRDQLAEIGVPDAMDVVAAADEVPELSLPRVVPGPPAPRRSRLPVVAAGALTIAALAAAQSGALGHRATSDRRPPDHHAPDHQPAGHQAPGRAPAAPAPAPAPARPEPTTAALAAARPAADAEPRVTAEVFWAGRLPGGARARWVCRRTAAPGRPTRSDGILIAGRYRRRTDCGHVHGATVGGTWWRAPNGRWYFVAAAGARFAVQVVAPRSSGYRVPKARPGLVAVPGPRGGARPPRGWMTVTAHRM